MIIDGKTIANDIIERLKSQPKPDKFFGAVLVGDDPADLLCNCHCPKISIDIMF
jgi:hypothetical protein